MLADSRWLLAAVAVFVFGCGVQVALTKRPGALSESQAASAKAHCEDVQVLRGRAPHDWVVVGVVDLAAFSVRRLPRDDEAFLELVRPAACEAGGDAVIPGVNGDGRYVLGTVIAWVEPDGATEPAPKEQAEEPKAGAEAEHADARTGERLASPTCPEDPASC